MLHPPIRKQLLPQKVYDRHTNQAIIFGIAFIACIVLAAMIILYFIS